MWSIAENAKLIVMSLATGAVPLASAMAEPIMTASAMGYHAHDRAKMIVKSLVTVATKRQPLHQE
jgi:F0F1-type ATP synthase membrane subunit c/vacuolar-type H+-ATPase subunit K